MEFIQILNRMQDEHGNWSVKWSDRLPLNVGYKENWVLDKTTDTAYCEFSYFDKDCVHPKWNIMDWCRILHIKDINEEIKYDEEGLPINFSEYVIGEIQANYVAKNCMWKIMLKLEEPIVRTCGVLGETLTYTNQREKNEDLVTFFHEPYNHLSALERWLKVTPANCDVYEKDESGRDIRNMRNISWYNRIKILDEDLLRNTEFADDTFNELNLYNVLMDNYDSSIGKTPALFFDMIFDKADKNYDLPRNSERDEYLLKFLNQDGIDKPVIDEQQSKEIFNNISSYQMSKSVSNYATGIATNAQNISTSISTFFPAERLYLSPEVNSNVRDTTKEDCECVLRFPNKIKNIIKLTKLEIIDLKYVGEEDVDDLKTVRLCRTESDITIYTKEKKQYNCINFTEAKPETKYVWYEEGDNLLHINEYKYIGNSTTSAIVYCVEYIPLIDARLEIGTNDFVQQVNQTSSQVDNQKFGDYLQNYLAGMNVDDLVIIKTFNSFFDFNDLIGRRVHYNGIEYLITNVSYQNRNFQYEVVFQLNENHFRKNDSVQASQNIRENIELATENLKSRKTFYRQIVKLSTQKSKSDKNQILMHNSILKLLSAITNEYSASDEPHYAGLIFKSVYKYGVRFPLVSGYIETGETNFEKMLFSPITKFRFGNSICFNIKTRDNAEIAKNKNFDSEVYERYEKKLTRINSQTPVLYTDKFGEVKTVDIIIGRSSMKPLVEYNEYENIKEEEKYNEIEQEITNTTNYYKMCNFIETNAKTSEWKNLQNTKDIDVTALNIQKDMLETFNLTLAINLTADNHIIVNPQLLDKSILFSSKSVDEEKKLEIAFYDTCINLKDDFSPISIIKINEVNADIENSTVKYSFNKYTIPFVSFSLLLNGEKMLIFNYLDDKIKKKISEGYFELYCN